MIVSLYLSVFACIHLYIYPSIHLSIYTSCHLFVCLSAGLSIHSFNQIFIYLMHTYVYLTYTFLFIRFSYVHTHGFEMELESLRQSCQCLNFSTHIFLKTLFGFWWSWVQAQRDQGQTHHIPHEASHSFCFSLHSLSGCVFCVAALALLRFLLNSAVLPSRIQHCTVL